MLPKEHRLPAKNFGSLYKKGKKQRGKYGMIVHVENSKKIPRFGFVVSKKIGNSVIRHRMTRLLRVVFMEIVKEKELSNLSKDFQYIAFSFCGEKELLKKEISLQMESILNV